MIILTPPKGVVYEDGADAMTAFREGATFRLGRKKITINDVDLSETVRIDYGAGSVYRWSAKPTKRKKRPKTRKRGPRP